MVPLESSVSGATIWSVTYVINYAPRVIIYAPRVTNHAPREHLQYKHHSRQSSYDDRNMFIVQVTETYCFCPVLQHLRCV